MKVDMATSNIETNGVVMFSEMNKHWCGRFTHINNIPNI
jgi:hypothetical protein